MISTPATTTKIPNYVGKLQEAFNDLFETMSQTISKIHRDAASPPNEPNQITFEQIPQLAERIIQKAKTIDNIIDEAMDQTCIGQDIQEIKNTLEQKREAYDKEATELDQYTEEANLWLQRIRQTLHVIYANTPWMQELPPNLNQ